VFCLSQIDQIAVPSNTNQESAVAAHLPQMDLAGVCITADAAHTTEANARQLSQNNGAEFLLFLKANQPLALAKAEQLQKASEVPISSCTIPCLIPAFPLSLSASAKPRLI